MVSLRLNNILPFLPVLIVLLLFSRLVYAQTNRNNNANQYLQLRGDSLNRWNQLANAFEHAGDYEKALGFYRQLYNATPTNIIFFDGVRRCYTQLKQYDSLIAILHRELETNRTDITLIGYLGDAYFKSGDQKKAFEIWEEGIRTLGNSAGAYRAIAHFVIWNRQYEKAISMLEKGREQSTDKLNFTQDIAGLYSAILRYEDATREYLALLKLSNGTMLDNVRIRISSYTSKPDGLQAALKVSSAMALENSSDIDYQKIYGWILLEAKRYDDAFAVEQHIDGLVKANGKEILSFGEQMMQDRAYSIAQRSFQFFIDHAEDSTLIPQARFGCAHAIEEQALRSDTSGRTGNNAEQNSSQLRKAIALYKKIAEDYPGSDYGLQSLIRAASLYYNSFFELNNSIDLLKKILSEYSSARYTPAVLFLLGDVYTARGDLQKADSLYSILLSPENGFVDDVRQLASMKSIRISYYRGEFDSVLAQLKPLAAASKFDVANDALELQIFLQQHIKVDREALILYAKAEFLTEQRNYSEALALLDDILQRFKSTLLFDDVLLRKAEWFRRIGHWPDAIQACERLLHEYAESIYADKALFMIGDIYEHDADKKQEAIQTYERLLEQFPSSFFTDDARIRIRRLRGESI